MRAKRKITRILITLMWVVLSAGLTVLLVAAIDIKNHKTCKDVQIQITGAKDYFFLNKRDILQIVSANGSGHLVGKPIETFDLQQLETLLRKNVWIKEARLFFDNNLVLHVSIFEREPVARVFDTGNQSFYIDSSGFRIPLGSKRITRLPVFTGFPAEIPEGRKSADSQLIRQMQGISRFVVQDSFWMAQIAQIDITPTGNFEIVPTVGNHLIEFGDGNNCESKFNRLFQFYKQVLAKYGFERYTRISVQYGSQIVGTRRGEVSRIDSIQALKNIQKILEEVKEAASDTLQATMESAPPVITNKPVDSILARNREEEIKPVKKPLVKPPVHVQKPVVPKPRQTNQGGHATKPKPVSSGVKPKAVMPRQN